MTTPITASYGTITLKAVGALPARLLGGAGIDVTPTNGFAYRVDMDIGELPTAPIGAANGKFTAVWDSADNTMKKIEFTALPAPIVDWTVITSKPSTFPPTLPIAESGVTNLPADLAARPTDAAGSVANDGKTYGRRNGAWFDVSAGVTISVAWTDITGKPSAFPPTNHTHVEGDITGLVADLAARELTANKGVANGYAALDATGRVPIAQGSLGDASSDGKAYGRLNGTWFPITGNFVSQNSPTGAGALPAGTTAQRPANSAGLIRYNSDLGAFEGNNGTAWSGIGGGAKISDTPPSTPQNGDLWWESDSGQLWIYFNDGSSSQFVAAMPTPDVSALVKKIGDTMTGSLQITASWPTLSLNKAAATEACQISGTLGNSTRWVIRLGNNTAETGSNAGSDFELLRWSDAGAYIDSPLTINRASGNATFSAAVTANTNFISSTVNAVLANNGSTGGIFLRPNGSASATGQAVLTSAGDLSVTNNLTLTGSNILFGSVTGQFWNNSVFTYNLSSTGFWPATDNTVYCGKSGNRFFQVWAGTATIQTSDENEKRDIRPLDEKERAAAQALKGLIVAYRWRPEAVSAHPEAAEKIYIGVIAQRVEAALRDAGLDPDAYSMWRKDEVMNSIPPVLGPDGNTISEGREEPTGEYLYSVDYPQVLAFIIGAL